MSRKLKLFLDAEHSGSHAARPDLISLGAVSEDGRVFYAELLEPEEKSRLYATYVWEAILRNLPLKKGVWEQTAGAVSESHERFMIRGTKEEVAYKLLLWLSLFDCPLEVWSSRPSADIPLVKELLGARAGEEFEAPMDLRTLLWTKGVSADIEKEAFLGITFEERTKAGRSALRGAELTKACFEKAIKM